MQRRLVVPLVFVGALCGCAGTTLRARREEPPRLTLPTQAVVLEVLDCPEAAALQQVLAEAVEATGQYGVQACTPGEPCGAGATLRAVVEDRRVTPRGNLPRTLHPADVLKAATDVKVTTRVHVEGFDRQGQKLFGRVYTGWKNGNTTQSPQDALVLESLRYALSGLTQDLGPRTLQLDLKLETGGALDDGVDLALRGDLDGALSAFAALTATRPDFAAAWYDLGVVAEVAGDDARAQDAYRRAAALDDEWLYQEALRQLEKRRQ